VAINGNSEAAEAASVELPPDSDGEGSNSGNDNQASRPLVAPNQCTPIIILVGKPPSPPCRLSDCILVRKPPLTTLQIVWLYTREEPPPPADCMSVLSKAPSLQQDSPAGGMRSGQAAVPVCGTWRLAPYLLEGILTPWSNMMVHPFTPKLTLLQLQDQEKPQKEAASQKPVQGWDLGFLVSNATQSAKVQRSCSLKPEFFPKRCFL